eukprot:s1648_g6.t1
MVVMVAPSVKFFKLWVSKPSKPKGNAAKVKENVEKDLQRWMLGSLHQKASCTLPFSRRGMGWSGPWLTPEEEEACEESTCWMDCTTDAGRAASMGSTGTTVTRRNRGDDSRASRTEPLEDDDTNSMHSTAVPRDWYDLEDQPGSSATYYSIADNDDASSLCSTESTMTGRGQKPGDEIAGSCEIKRDSETRSSSWKEPTSTSLDLTPLPRLNDEAEKAIDQEEPRSISLADRVGWCQPCFPVGQLQRPGLQQHYLVPLWSVCHGPMVVAKPRSKQVIQLDPLIRPAVNPQPLPPPVSKYISEMFQKLGREGFLQKRIHRKLQHKAAGLNDSELQRIGEMSFDKQRNLQM